MDDIRETRRPGKHLPPNELRPTLAGTETIIVLIAFLSGLVLLDVRDFSGYSPFDSTTAGSRFQAVLPQLLVITLGTTGVSRLGDFVAIIVACWTGWLCGGAIAFTEPGFMYALVFLLQLLILTIAIMRAWGRRDVGVIAVGPRRRLIGLGASAAVGVVWYLLAHRA